MTVPPFRFRLERLRELREHDEERAREELAASLGAQLRGQAMLRAAAELVDQAHTSRRESATASAADLVAHQRWVERLQRQRADAELALDRASADVEARRAALVEASRRREALERLKERRRQEHRAKADRAEGAVLDEIAINAHVRHGLRATG